MNYEIKQILKQKIFIRIYKILQLFFNWSVEIHVSWMCKFLHKS